MSTRKRAPLSFSILLIFDPFFPMKADTSFLGIHAVTFVPFVLFLALLCFSCAAFAVGRFADAGGGVGGGLWVTEVLFLLDPLLAFGANCDGESFFLS